MSSKGKQNNKEKANGNGNVIKQTVPNFTANSNTWMIMIPNSITMLNALSAFVVVLLLTHAFSLVRLGNKDDALYYITNAGWTIVFGMWCDALDGTVARLTKTSGNFGAELDSLCDAIAFGFVPAYLMFVFFDLLTFPEFVIGDPSELLTSSRLLMIIGSSVYIVCALVRLARFNSVSDQKDNHNTFKGLPSPAGGSSLLGLFSIYAFFWEGGSDSLLRSLPFDVQFYLYHLIPFFTAFFGFLMISNIRYYHFMKTNGISFVATFIASALALIYRSHWRLTASVYALLYILHGPIVHVFLAITSLFSAKPHSKK